MNVSFKREIIIHGATIELKNKEELRLFLDILDRAWNLDYYMGCQHDPEHPTVKFAGELKESLEEAFNV